MTLNTIPQPQTGLTTPEGYVEFLHPPAEEGRIAIAHREPDGKWNERSVTLRQAVETVLAWTGREDCYVSMNRFKGRRSLANLWSLRALWVDLDFHKLKKWQHWADEGVWGLVVPEYLTDARLPQPSMAIASGRGLYLLWLFRTVPAAALSRWTACQQQIFEAFKGLGADRQAMDAARVLRVVGTINSKSGQVVHVLGGSGYVWDFDALADEILPLRRTELQDLQIQRALNLKKRKAIPPQHQSVRSLWAARLTDINTLIQLRYYDGQIPSGERDAYIFLAAICMSWIASDPQVLEQEIVRFAQDHTPWSDREVRSRVSAVIKRMEMFKRGETVEWLGRQVDPRYRLRTRTIIEWLGITDQEQRHLTTLIGSKEKRRRRGFRMTRQAYLAHSRERDKPWKQLGMSRATWYAVGKPLPEQYLDNPDNQ
ncbi:hypothetical protein Sulac_0373 [Sulfobacillus acidophilus DSM 10332]|uniref:Replication protein n=1 Tax=Sulfobacillus acidophilus (strain ATCC 700253 / DSM 10332 / NAL) TaxID=679936 RepID=G8TY35_SULAD|nr:hypothetical protein Sulac_0373 [Sulfobacillus acidophilus DSM 10332]